MKTLILWEFDDMANNIQKIGFEEFHKYSEISGCALQKLIHRQSLTRNSLFKVIKQCLTNTTLKNKYEKIAQTYYEEDYNDYKRIIN